jgi:hypothetical protein
MNNEMRSMIMLHCRSSIIIEQDFPMKDLIRILRPYYYLYLVSKYHICGLEKRQMATEYLSEKLYELYIYNPLFGRKTFKHFKQNKTRFGNEKMFNMDAPKFTMNQAYMYHHLKKQNCSDDETDIDDDDDSVS